jgi:hypothetical protein
MFAIRRPWDLPSSAPPAGVPGASVPGVLLWQMRRCVGSLPSRLRGGLLPRWKPILARHCRPSPHRAGLPTISALCWLPLQLVGQQSTLTAWLGGCLCVADAHREQHFVRPGICGEVVSDHFVDLLGVRPGADQDDAQKIQRRVEFRRRCPCELRLQRPLATRHIGLQRHYGIPGGCYR